MTLWGDLLFQKHGKITHDLRCMSTMNGETRDEGNDSKESD